MKQDSFFVFRSDLSSFPVWKNNFSNLRAIWYDGTSDIIESLINVLDPETLIVEDDLIEPLINLTGFKGKILTSKKRLELVDASDSLAGKTIAIFPSNDTHIFLMRNVIIQLKKFMDVTIFAPSLKEENATRELDNLGLNYQNFFPVKDISVDFDGLLLANDWGIEERYLSYLFQKSGKPVICLQESVIQFGDYQHRMEWCDFPFVQGIYTLKNLKRELIFLTGNPRYEQLTLTDQSQSTKALINCNFTYGIFESARTKWLEDIISVLNELHLEYLIAQHPRDTGNLKQYQTIVSTAATIHDLIKSSSILITRFSSLIHESLALGRTVIYYNPHRENMYYDFAPDNLHLILANSKEELRNAIKKLLNSNQGPKTQGRFFQEYGMSQHGSSDGQATQRVIEALKIALTTQYRQSRQSINKFKLMAQYQQTKWKQIFRQDRDNRK